MAQVTARELVGFFKKNGFIEDRQKGSHLTLRHPEKKLTITIPIRTGCDIGRGLAKRILSNAGFSVEDFLGRKRKIILNIAATLVPTVISE